MSDSAPVATEAPAPSSEIASQVISDAEAQDTGSESTGESRIDTTNTYEEPTQKVETQRELTAAEKFLEKMGHKPKKVDGRDNWLPHRSIPTMLDKYVEEQRQAWDAEKQTLSAQATRAQELQGHLESLIAGVRGDPRAFLEELSGLDPRYRSFLEQKAAEAAQAPLDMPELDYQLPDGSRTYSSEGIQKKLIPWLTQVIAKQLESKVDEKLRPIAEREKAEQQRVQQEHQQRQLQERVGSQLSEAQTWPLFGKLADDGTYTEFQTAVLDELKKDSAQAQAEGKRPSLSLEGAYIKVASKRMTEDETAKRARWAEEVNKAPKSTAISRQSTDAPKVTGPRSSADIARATIAKLENLV